ncbi:MAG: phytoene/squalene synthase family protein [Bacteroidota bacterium]
MALRPEAPALRQDRRRCRLLTRRHARSFYFASRVLPRGKREAAYAVYAFCREADNAADTPGAGSRQERKRLLAGLRERLGDMYRDAPGCAFPALAEAVRTYGIPREHLEELLTGVEMDLEGARYKTFEELELYCHRVASVVGLVMACIFGAPGAKSAPHAAAMGTAMQLTNILRDVGEDLRMKRIYLPAEDLQWYGVTEEDLTAGRISPGFVELMRCQIARAREFYAVGEEGIPMLGDAASRACVRIMGRVYASILDGIEANGYDVFTRRAYVPFLRKLAIAGAALVAPNRWRGGGSGARPAEGGARVCSGREGEKPAAAPRGDAS